MSNEIVATLDRIAQKLGATLGEDGSKAVEKLYRLTGSNGEKIIEKTAETDAEHAAKITDILKKLEANADKDHGTGLQRAENNLERAKLRERLGEALGVDRKDPAMRDAYRDTDKAKDAVAKEAKAAGNVTRVGQLNGRDIPMSAKSRGRLDVSHLTPDEQVDALRSETRKLGDDTIGDEGLTEPKPVCSCGLLHDGTVSTHTSMLGNFKKQTPTVHPALKSVLDDIKASGDPVGRGHGKCGEVGAISDELWRIDPNGDQIRTLDDLKAALKNPDGSNAKIYSTIIGDSYDDAGSLAHGDYLHPCETCDPLLQRIEVDAVS